jgi:hypothetical protein
LVGFFVLFAFFVVRCFNRRECTGIFFNHKERIEHKEKAPRQALPSGHPQVVPLTLSKDRLTATIPEPIRFCSHHRFLFVFYAFFVVKKFRLLLGVCSFSIEGAACLREPDGATNNPKYPKGKRPGADAAE